MSENHKPSTMQIKLDLSKLGLLGRLTLLALLQKFATASDEYKNDADFKSAIDKAVAHAVPLGKLSHTAEEAKKAATLALVARANEEAATDADLNVARALSEKVCKTEAALQANGWNRRTKAVAVPLIPPVTVTGAPSKKAKQAVSLHAVRIAGLTKYICAMAHAATPDTYEVQAGTTAKREIGELESGKGYWFKFCTERGQKRSTWSEAVYVIAS